MKIVQETEPGNFVVFKGGVVARMEAQAIRKTNWHDGRSETETIDVEPYSILVKAGLAVVQKWSDQERTAHGLFVVEPAALPDGHRFVSGSPPTYSLPAKDGPVVKTRETETKPLPKSDTRTVAEKFSAMAVEFGMTKTEFANQVEANKASVK